MTGNRMRGAIAIAVLAAWAMAAGGTLAAGSDVTIAGFAFSPQTIKISAGDSVTWTNNDGADHTATGADFDAGTIAANGGTATVKFSTAGTFAYACSIHPSMTGTVVVSSAGRGAGSTLPPTDAAAMPARSGGGAGTLLLLALTGVTGAVLLTRRLAHRR